MVGMGASAHTRVRARPAHCDCAYEVESAKWRALCIIIPFHCVCVCLEGLFACVSRVSRK